MKYLVALALLLACGQVFAQTAPAPTCYPPFRWPPTAAWGSVPATVSTTNTFYGVWVCEHPGGYETAESLFNWSDISPYIPQYLLGLLSVDQINALMAAKATPFTDAENAFMTPLVQSNRPKAVVAFNGASTTRSVYTLNADGTLNTAPIAGKSIQVATRCDETKRIPTAPAYYSVAGQKDQAGNPLPAGTYTICVVALPLKAN